MTAPRQHWEEEEEEGDSEYIQRSDRDSFYILSISNERLFERVAAWRMLIFGSVQVDICQHLSVVSHYFSCVSKDCFCICVRTQAAQLINNISETFHNSQHLSLYSLLCISRLPRPIQSGTLGFLWHLKETDRETLPAGWLPHSRREAETF